MLHTPIATTKFHRYTNNEELSNMLLDYEKNELVRQYKFGVLYCKAGQVTEDKMFSNQRGSQDFDKFLKFLGKKIKLKV